MLSCKHTTESSPEKNILVKQEYGELKKDINFKYAKGITIEGSYNSYIITIKNPWQNAENNLKYKLLDSSIESNDIISEEFENVFYMPKSIVVTSTTHIPALELLGVEQTLVGFPETNFISSKNIRKRIDNGQVRDLGKNESINTEVLLDLNPDMVISFSISGSNKAYEVIQNAKIPVVYNGDWLEGSPLAKAEWIKFFGVLYGKEKEADSIFNIIEKDYLEAKLLAKNTLKQPTIISGAMHKDVWYLPNGTSTEAQLLKDANTNYLWNDTSGNGSLALSFETIIDKGLNADIWLSPSNYKSLKALKEANANYARFKAFNDKQVYTFSNTTGETGGILYYELGLTRPDIVLKDIIKICHPNVLPDHELFFFKPLN